MRGVVEEVGWGFLFVAPLPADVLVLPPCAAVAPAAAVVLLVVLEAAPVDLEVAWMLGKGCSDCFAISFFP